MSSSPGLIKLGMVWQRVQTKGSINNIKNEKPTGGYLFSANSPPKLHFTKQFTPPSNQILSGWIQINQPGKQMNPINNV